MFTGSEFSHGICVLKIRTSFFGLIIVMKYEILFHYVHLLYVIKNNC